MYTVRSGEQYAKITITDAETVKFSDKWDVFAVKGEGITVKLAANDSGDGVYSTDDLDGSVIIAHNRRLDTMYLTGTGDVIVWAGASAVDCPFKKKAKGGGSGGSSETNIIPLATPSVVKIEGYEGDAYRSEINGVYMWKSYDYGNQVSCYIDVSTIVSSDILCSNTAKIKLGAALYSNYYSGITNTLQMYIGNGAPSENDWVTVVSHLVPESTPYKYIDDINVSDINVSGATDGKIYFRMIHGSETSGYNTYIHVFYMNISDE